MDTHSSAAERLKGMIRRLLPTAVQRQVKRLYYPLVLKRFSEARWPAANHNRVIELAQSSHVPLG